MTAEGDKIQRLQSEIRQLGRQLDQERAAAAAALGLGVFAWLLALGALYDVLAGNTAVWLRLGISRTALIWIAAGLGLIGALSLATAIKRLDQPRQAELAELERQLEQALDQNETARTH
jgi:prefoldin subunit 5